jgi:putative membrane protein
MLKKMFFFGAIAMMFTMSAFAQDTMTTDNTMKSDKKTMSGKKNPDSKFMMTLATGGMNEITLSQTAVSKSTNEEVKSYAQKMIDDHTMAGDELKALAMTKNVTLPMQPDAKHVAMNTKLEGMTGSKFDMEYVKAMVKDHEATVALLQKESTNGKDPEAKAFAAKLLPTVQGHLEMAKTMMASMSGKKDMKMMEKTATTN